jgi:hypothetical protein
MPDLQPPVPRSLVGFVEGRPDPPVRPEVTPLTRTQELAFRRWTVLNGITDVDHPDSFYDYRGYWKDVASKGVDQRKAYDDGLHFPDTYKQHGHPTFSQESQYSRGLWDGGRWVGEDYLAQPPMAVAHGGVGLAQFVKQRQPTGVR